VLTKRENAISYGKKEWKKKEDIGRDLFGKGGGSSPSSERIELRVYRGRLAFFPKNA